MIIKEWSVAPSSVEARNKQFFQTYKIFIGNFEKNYFSKLKLSHSVSKTLSNSFRTCCMSIFWNCNSFIAIAVSASKIVLQEKDCTITIRKIANFMVATVAMLLLGNCELVQIYRNSFAYNLVIFVLESSWADCWITRGAKERLTTNWQLNWGNHVSFLFLGTVCW